MNASVFGGDHNWVWLFMFSGGRGGVVAGAGDEELGDVFLRRFFGRPAEDEGVAGVAFDWVGLDGEAAGAIVGGEKIGAADKGTPALAFDCAGVGPDACLVRTVATVYG